MGDEQQGPVRWLKQKGYQWPGLDGFPSCYGSQCHSAYADPFRLKMGLEGWPLENFLFSQRMQYPHGSSQLSITLVPRDPMPPSNFQGRQTRAWAKCSHTLKKIHHLPQAGSHFLHQPDNTQRAAFTGSLQTPGNSQTYNWPQCFLKPWCPLSDLQTQIPTGSNAFLHLSSQEPLHKALTTCCH